MTIKPRRTPPARVNAAVAGRLSWVDALAQPCPTHGAAPGEHCYTFPPGLCDARARAAGYTGNVSDRGPKPPGLSRRFREAVRPDDD